MIMKKGQLIESLKKAGFSEKIVSAFRKVRREDFVPENYKEFAYVDEPLPIGWGQTISQPYTIAFMLDLLELKDNLKILEVGSGSGYVLALINQISANSEIYGIERIRELADNSQRVLRGEKRIKVIHGNGSKGLKEEAPFDRILVSASSDKIPEELLKQLGKDGILVCVVKNSIIRIKRTLKGDDIEEYPGFGFVKLICGEEL